MAYIANDGRSYESQAAADAANKRMAATGATPVSTKATSNPIANVNGAQTQLNSGVNAGGQALSAVQKANLEKQNAQLNGTMTQVQAAQAREQATADALKKSTTINNYTSQDPNQIAAQQKINQQYNLDPMTGFKGQAINMQAGQTMARDFAREQAMAKKLGGLPETPEETAKMLQATYSPDELQKLGLSNYIQKALSPASTGGAGISLPSGVPGVGAQAGAGQYLSAQQLSDMGLTSDKLKSLVAAGNITQQQADQISKTGLEMDKAQQLLNSTPKPTNATIGVLEAALKAKSGVGNQPLGESDLFKQAGLNGYAVLAQNLAQHSREMDQKYQSYANLVGETSGAMADVWQKALDGYKAAQDSFNKQAELLTRAKEKADDWDHALKQMEKQNELDIQKQETLYKLQQKYDKDKYQFQTVTNEDGSTSMYAFNPTTREVTSIKGPNGEVVAGDGYDNTGANSDPGNYPTIGNNEYLLGDKIVDKSVYDAILGVGTTGDWCGVYGSKMSTGHKVGNTWAEKKANMDVTAKDMALGKYQPKLGDKLLIPLGVKTGKNPWGHVAFVTGYNPETGDIYVTESNKDGRQKDSYKGAKGVVTAGKYNIKDLSGGKYGGTDWGLVKGNLKSQYAQKITDAMKSFERTQTAPNNNKGWMKVADAFKEMGIKKFSPFATSVLVGNTENYGLEDLSGVQGKSFSKPQSSETPFVPKNGSEQMAWDIMQSMSGYKLADVPQKQRAGVAEALNKLKADALKSGDVVGYVKASGGGKALSDSAAQSFEKAQNVLNQVGGLQETISKMDTGPIQGLFRNANPYDVDKTKLKAQLQAIVPNLARGIYGEVGVLTNADIDNYIQTLPNGFSTDDQKKALMDFTMKTIKDSITTKLKNSAMAGFDVSGYAPLLVTLNETQSTPVNQKAPSGDGVLDMTDAQLYSFYNS